MCDIVPGYPIPALTLEKTGSGIEGSLYIFLMMRICICRYLYFYLYLCIWGVVGLGAFYTSFSPWRGFVFILVFVLVLVYLRGSGIEGNLYILLMMSIFVFVFVYLRRRWLDDNIYISSMTRIAMRFCICVILYLPLEGWGQYIYIQLYKSQYQW